MRALTTGDGEKPLAAVNDVIADAKGGVYFTDPNVRPIVPGRKVYVYYLPPGSSRARVVDDTMTRPNGLILTLDGRTLLVDDTVGHDVFAFDVRPDGSLGDKRVFARLRDIKAGEDSGADGMAIDREGAHLRNDYYRRADVRSRRRVSGQYPGAAQTDQRRVLRTRQKHALHHGARRAVSHPDACAWAGALGEVTHRTRL